MNFFAPSSFLSVTRSCRRAEKYTPFNLGFSLSVNDLTNYLAFKASAPASVSCNQTFLNCFSQAFKESAFLEAELNVEFRQKLVSTAFSRFYLFHFC